MFVDFSFLSLISRPPLPPVFDNKTPFKLRHKTKTTYTSQSQSFPLCSFIYFSFLSLSFCVLEHRLPTQRHCHATAVRSHFYVFVLPLCAYIFLIHRHPRGRRYYTKPRHTQSRAPVRLTSCSSRWASYRITFRRSNQTYLSFPSTVSPGDRPVEPLSTRSRPISLVSCLSSRPLDLFSLFSSLSLSLVLEDTLIISAYLSYNGVVLLRGSARVIVFSLRDDYRTMEVGGGGKAHKARERKRASVHPLAHLISSPLDLWQPPHSCKQKVARQRGGA